jgi:transcriptional regulator with XRE-family HTH domain
MKFGSEMRKARKHHGASLREVASLLGMSSAALGRMERGRSMPSRRWIEVIEKKIGAEPGSLVAAARHDVGQHAMELWDGGEVNGWIEAEAKALDDVKAHAKFLKARKAMGESA